MARKSRKYLIDNNIVPTPELIKKYRAGIYTRISVEESKNESSIDTQEYIVKAFIDDKSDMEYIKTYTDNGYSSFDKIRPAFDEMINDAKSGIINCVIVKDQSRFGRNYMETGHLLESVLPFLGIRFISVDDGYDSDVLKYRDSLAIPFKSIINHYYSVDISHKVKSVFKIKRENGTYVAAHAPFGYKKTISEQGNVYEIDDIEAEIVKFIFGRSASGISIYQITKELNQLNREISGRSWTQKYVGRILRNDFYIGTYTAGKTSSMFTLNTHKKVPQDEWIVIENHHPAMIDKTIFDVVQIKNLKHKYYIDNENQVAETPPTFSSKIFCGDCGRKLKRVRQRLKNGEGDTFCYICPKYAESSGGRCSRKTIREDKLRCEIWRLIDVEIQKADDYRSKQQQYENSITYKLWVDARQLKLAKLKKELREYTNADVKMTFYDSLDIDNGYSDTDFKSVMRFWKGKADVLKNEIAQVESELIEYSNKKSPDCIWVRNLLKWQGVDSFQEDAVDELVDRILVDNDGIRVSLIVKMNLIM